MQKAHSGDPPPLSSILRDCDQKLAVASCRRKTTAAGRVPQMDGMGVGRRECSKEELLSQEEQRQCLEAERAGQGTCRLKAHFSPLQHVNLTWILILKVQIVKKKKEEKL